MNKFQKITAIVESSALSNLLFVATTKLIKKDSDPMDNNFSPIALMFVTGFTSSASIGLSLLENLINKNVTDDVYLQSLLGHIEVATIFNFGTDILLSLGCKNGFVEHFKHGMTANLFMPSLSHQSILAKALNINAIWQVLAATYILNIDESSDDWSFFKNDTDENIHSDMLL